MYPVINTILNFESIYLIQARTTLIYFVYMYLRLQQIRTLVHSMTLFLHHMSIISIRSELQKYIFVTMLLLLTATTFPTKNSL
jgi:hypothetical protein